MAAAVLAFYVAVTTLDPLISPKDPKRYRRLQQMLHDKATPLSQIEAYATKVIEEAKDRDLVTHADQIRRAVTLAQKLGYVRMEQVGPVGGFLRNFAAQLVDPSLLIDNVVLGLNSIQSASASQRCKERYERTRPSPFLIFGAFGSAFLAYAFVEGRFRRAECEGAKRRAETD